jgi:F0F1-type ATP synthase assembly protein I
VIADGFHDAITATLWTLGALAGAAIVVLPIFVFIWIAWSLDLNWKLRRWLYQHRRS